MKGNESLSRVVNAGGRAFRVVGAGNVDKGTVLLLTALQERNRSLLVGQIPAECLVDNDGVGDRCQVAGGAIRHALVVGINAGPERAIVPGGLFVEVAESCEDPLRIY